VEIEGLDCIVECERTVACNFGSTAPRRSFGNLNTIRFTGNVGSWQPLLGRVEEIKERRDLCINRKGDCQRFAAEPSAGSPIFHNVSPMARSAIKTPSARRGGHLALAQRDQEFKAVRPTTLAAGTDFVGDRQAYVNTTDSPR
jgi:hypothetical protein